MYGSDDYKKFYFIIHFKFKKCDQLYDQPHLYLRRYTTLYDSA